MRGFPQPHKRVIVKSKRVETDPGLTGAARWVGVWREGEMVQAGKAGFGSRRNTVSWIAFAALALSACDGGFSPRDATRAGSVLELTTPASGRVVDRDVPAPQVFDLT